VVILGCWDKLHARDVKRVKHGLISEIAHSHCQSGMLHLRIIA
jgi:hypothetical protein